MRWGRNHFSRPQAKFGRHLTGRIAARILVLPPGNRLEQLSGDRIGQHRIRINDQWRICFRWRDGDAYDVEITDYH